VESGDQVALQTEHLALLLGLGVIEAQQVQQSVRGEQDQLVDGRVAGRLSLRLGDLGQSTMSPSSPGGVGCSCVPGRNSSIGKLSTSVGPARPSTARAEPPWRPRRRGGSRRRHPG
jgi:hypothetical protein